MVYRTAYCSIDILLCLCYNEVMSEPITKKTTQSALTQFKLGYELDRSWSQAKKHVKSRTIDPATTA